MSGQETELPIVTLKTLINDLSSRVNRMEYRIDRALCATKKRKDAYKLQKDLSELISSQLAVEDVNALSEFIQSKIHNELSKIMQSKSNQTSSQGTKPNISRAIDDLNSRDSATSEGTPFSVDDLLIAESYSTGTVDYVENGTVKLKNSDRLYTGFEKDISKYDIDAGQSVTISESGIRPTTN